MSDDVIKFTISDGSKTDNLPSNLKTRVDTLPKAKYVSCFYCFTAPKVDLDYSISL